MNQLQLSCRNFRKLHDFTWAPEGVSLLLGPNGAGKTSAIDLLRFLRGTFSSGIEDGFRAARGGDHFPSRGCPDTEPVTFELRVGEIRWRLELPMSAAGLKGLHGEELYRGDELILKAGIYEKMWTNGQETVHFREERCCAKVLWDRGSASWMEPLHRVLTNLRTYDFWLNQVREGTTREDRAAFLHGTGKNLWAVLANWKQAPMRFQDQFGWVIREAHRAFPDLLQTIEFEGGEAYLFPPGTTDPADGLPPRRQADGLLTGLLLLTAVAGAKPGSVLAFDEMENQLHPHAIRSILHSMRARAEEQDLIIVLTTHSPLVMNEFGEEPGRVWVLDPKTDRTPTRLDELKNPEWLAMFPLGELYDRMKFAAPPGASNGETALSSNP